MLWLLRLLQGAGLHNSIDNGNCGTGAGGSGIFLDGNAATCLSFQNVVSTNASILLHVRQVHQLGLWGGGLRAQIHWINNISGVH